MKPLERAKLLLAKARDDENLIDVVISSKIVSDEIIGFHAQQAVEKLLKTVLMAKEIPYRRTHDIRELIDLIKDHNIEFPDALMEVRSLSPFAVEFRYDYFPPERESHFNRQENLEMVRQLRAWVEKVIKQ